jgi:hypothetical protein
MKKPIKEKIEVLNLLDVLEYLESIGHKGIKDRIFKELCDTIGIKNDTYIDYFFSDEDYLDDEFDDDHAEYETHLNDLNIIKTEFDIDDRIVFYISW